MKSLLTLFLSFTFSLSSWPASKLTNSVPRGLPTLPGKFQSEYSALSETKGDYKNLSALSCAISQDHTNPLSNKDLVEMAKSDEILELLMLQIYSYFSLSFVNLGDKGVVASYGRLNLFLKNHPELLKETLDIFKRSSADQLRDRLNEKINSFSGDNDLDFQMRAYWQSALNATEITTAFFYRYFDFYSRNVICGISLIEYFSLFSYAGISYLLLAKETLVLPSLRKTLLPLEKNLNLVLKKLSAFQGNSILIGTYLNPKEWASILKSGRIDYSGFVSGSINQTFAGFTKNAVLKVVKNKTGRLVAPVSPMPHEGEVLWSKPKFKILNSVLDEKGNLWLDVEEI